jgi:hypothetical protein
MKTLDIKSVGEHAQIDGPPATYIIPCELNITYGCQSIKKSLSNYSGYLNDWSGSLFITMKGKVKDKISEMISKDDILEVPGYAKVRKPYANPLFEVIEFSYLPTLVVEHLYKFIELKDLDGIEKSIKEGTDIECFGHLNKETPLIYAARRSNTLPILKKLIDAGAYIDSKSMYGYTALMTSAEGGNYENFSFLLEQGVHHHARDEFGNTLLHYALRGENREIIDWTLKNHPEDINVKARF